MLTQLVKRNGDLVPFRQEKITWAIFKAANAVGGHDWDRAAELSDAVVKIASEKYPSGVAGVEDIQDIV